MFLGDKLGVEQKNVHAQQMLIIYSSLLINYFYIIQYEYTFRKALDKIDHSFLKKMCLIVGHEFIYLRRRINYTTWQLEQFSKNRKNIPSLEECMLNYKVVRKHISQKKAEGEKKKTRKLLSFKMHSKLWTQLILNV